MHYRIHTLLIVLSSLLVFALFLEYNALSQNILVNEQSCSEIVKQQRPKNWEDEKNWMLCHYSYELVSSKKHIAFKPYVVTVPVFGRRRSYPQETNIYCATVLRSRLGEVFYDNRWSNANQTIGKSAISGPLKQEHFDYCNNALVKVVVEKEVELIRIRRERIAKQLSDEQWWKSFRWEVIKYSLLGGALLAPVLLYRKRQTLYAMFIRHPAQNVVDRALSSGGRVATPELHAVLKKTSEIATRPPAPWKTKVMTEKAEEMTRRLDEESRLAEAAIERDRQRQRQKWESEE